MYHEEHEDVSITRLMSSSILNSSPDNELIQNLGAHLKSPIKSDGVQRKYKKMRVTEGTT